MPIRNIDKLVDVLPRQGRLMALDVGEKTIGIAFSDVLRTIASPRTTILRQKFKQDAFKLLEFAESEEVVAIVLGLPINMNGSEGPRSQSTRQFAVNLSKRTPINITFWDERLSTIAAKRTMIEANLSRRRQKALVDKIAAAFILQGAIDFLNREK
ncbi:MAG: Holliday junction resolvase RuvX [Rhodospirillaceae bacterium]|nr:Holliday junction resolvase RuvX [Rhodospirillaceae bacterium]|tara:strand:+ start:1652 stop:2119 length:468 start_codon:yes stop_codon:yes gene_type:complete